ncbi:MAG: 50S ribosomal protein L18 [Candidatus Doudnabacteria bacterium]|nr:50S ribosomal protein L18 [Candidatus Doudnabacteria bacterium]
MNSNKQKRAKRIIRHKRVRSTVAGTADRPRLSVFRANTHIYAQVIDDLSGKTLVSASSLEVSAKGGPSSGGKAKAKKSDMSKEVGKMIAQKAMAKNIKAVRFDRGGFAYHGRVKALADGAREGGLEF